MEFLNEPDKIDSMKCHDLFMRAALREARKGLGFTSPNPAVGAVVVRRGRIISRGWHRKAGAPHAEVEALNALQNSKDAEGSTLYVTLEPCSTHGRTPPCTEAILRSGISKVVIGGLDPNPVHAGRAVELLRNAGVEVVTGVEGEACRFLNRAFFKWITTRRPWVLVKAALSLDGRLSRPPGEGKWLSGMASLRDAHKLRRMTDAILVGANTLRTDNPSLTIRYGAGKGVKEQPWRVVLTRGGTPLPQDAHLFQDEYRERTVVFKQRPLESVLSELGDRYGVNHLLVEGGAEVLGGFFDAGLVDEVCFYLTSWICGGPRLGVGGQGVERSAEGLRILRPEYRHLGRDVVLQGLVDRPLARRVCGEE